MWLQLPLKDAPSNILAKHVYKDMWQAHSNKSHLHVVKPRMLSDFSAKLNEVKAAMMDAFTELPKNSRFSHILYLTNTYVWAFGALDCLT